MAEAWRDPAPESRLARDLIRAIGDSAALASVGVVVTRTNSGRQETLYTSSGLARILGFTPEDGVAHKAWDHLAPQLPFIAGPTSTPVTELSHASGFETTATKQDGSPVPLEITVCPAIVDGYAARVTLVFDRSEREEAEQALKSSDTRFRSVVESAPDGVAILRGARILYLNPRAARMLGYDFPEQATGDSIGERLVPEDAAKARERIEALERTGQSPSGPGHYRPKRSDGVQTVIEISSILIDYDGAPAVLAFARDITERAAIQKRLLRADRLAAVGTLAAGVAHEINNPLSYISLSIQYVERELRNVDPAVLDTAPMLRRLAEALHGAERVSSIVRDLKAFSRDDDARSTIHLETVVENALRIAENEVRHRARLVRDYRDAPPVIANAARLEQVFLNLIVNAAQALGDGDPSRDEIRISVRGEGTRVVVEVTDTGPGIPTELQSRIFDPFFTTKPVGVGTGLGLPICQGIVTAAGGQLDLLSSVGRGTIARVTLPAQVEQLPADPAHPVFSVPAPSSGRRRILIVDDEPFVGRVLRGLLAGTHDVRVAMSGAEALEVIRDQGFDAILCDVMMPGMTGVELYAAIQSGHPGLERRVIFMTGGAFVPKVADFLSRVDNPTIDKPFDYTVLLQALDSLPLGGALSPQA